MPRLVQNYQIFQKIEGGTYGKVYKGVNLLNQRRCAIKCYSQLDDLELMRYEYNILKDLHHKNIIGTLCYFEQFDKKREKIRGYMVMERGEIDLFEYLEDTRDFKRVLRYVFDVMQGIQYIHDKNILHGDLKLENVIISKGVAKLVDFGMSIKMRNPVHFLDYRIGSKDLIPPEVEYNKYCSLASDIWCLGKIIRNIYDKFAVRRDLPLESLKKIGIQCLQHNFLQRPTIQKVIELFNTEFELYINIRKRRISI